MPQLVNADTELTVHMSGADALVAACHDVRVEAHANRNSSTVSVSEVFEHSQRVDVDHHTQFDSLLIFGERDHVRREEYLVRKKTRVQSNTHFLYAHGIQSAAHLAHPA